jgi:hypothetical protein
VSERAQRHARRADAARAAAGSRTPRRVVLRRVACACAVPVLCDIEIKVGELGDGKALQRLARAVKLKSGVGVVHLGLEGVELGEHPAVDLGQLRERHRVLGGREVVQVADEITERVAQLAVGLEDLLEDVGPDGDVGRIVDGRDPEP